MLDHRNDLITLGLVCSLVESARRFPIDQLAKRSTGSVAAPSLGESIVSDLLDMLLVHEWHSPLHEAAGDEVLSSLNILDMGADRISEWSVLFSANTGLRRYLERLEADAFAWLGRAH